MQETYPFAEVEARWQAYWEEQGLFRTNTSRADGKYYCLMMFPYPSAALHVGHGRNYIMGDAVARYKKMRGFRVLTPMGWDAFGLPAENAAIKSGVHPRQSTEANIATMKRQLASWGVCYDWDREIASCSVDYYRWTQWLFLKFLERGLAYRGMSTVNWCPSCATVLANEQVVEERCERCESLVQQQRREQWFFKITDYAQRLLDDLHKLDAWPERVRTMQRNWIGRSEGAAVQFELAPRADGRPDPWQTIECFTTRVDTIYGCTYMVLAPEYPHLDALVAGLPEAEAVQRFAAEAARQTAMERTADTGEKQGVFTGRHVVNPYTQEEIPLWVGDYVLMEYGSGAVMAVPAHDTRDWAFARRHGLPIRLSIQNEARSLSLEEMTEAYVEPGWTVDSGPFSDLPSEEAIQRMTRHAQEQGFGGPQVHTRLRDWLISRQRYWGAPIPVIHCASCGPVPVPEADLPVRLPEQVEFRPTGESPLANCEEFMQAPCPRCGAPARRESDTMDTFVDSSWYFLRYLSPRDDTRPFDSEACNQWLPVDQYIGGIEHAILHLMYARFFTKVLYDLDLIGVEEPFARLFTQGMICKRSEKDNQLYKMSKSKGNVVNPDALIEQYGADTLRLYTLFIGPPERDAEWKDDGIEGAARFLRRLWRRVYEHRAALASAPVPSPDPASLSGPARQLHRKTHETIQRVTHDMEGAFHFNSAIAQIMELTNAMDEQTVSAQSPDAVKAVYREAMETVLQLLSPFAPHVAEELWRELGQERSLLETPWPTVNPQALVREEVQMVVQVNGRVRDRITVPSAAGREQIESAALQADNIRKHLEGKTVRKIVVVPGTLVNIVAG